MINYEIKKIDNMPLKNVDWQAIAGKNLVCNLNGEPALHNTNFKLAYSEGGIYFCFVQQGDLPFATMTEYNAPLYDEEVVELYFSSTGDFQNYLEVEFNVLNTVFCANVFNDLKGKTTLDYVKKNIIQSYVQFNRENIEVYGFIPKELFSNFDNKQWLFNAYRIERTKNNQMILSSFAPTMENNFHLPKKFAQLKLL
ncbi:MAG: carbohydrate-binding family 9-like protein [Clostridia bacterium]